MYPARAGDERAWGPDKDHGTVRLGLLELGWVDGSSARA